MKHVALSFFCIALSSAAFAQGAYGGVQPYPRYGQGFGLNSGANPGYQLPSAGNPAYSLPSTQNGYALPTAPVLSRASTTSRPVDRPTAPGGGYAPYQDPIQHPSAAWSAHAGSLVRPAADSGWVVQTTGSLPAGSTVSIIRDGRVVDGGKVVQSGDHVALVEPWAKNDLHAGDLVALEAVAVPQSTPVIDRYQVNQQAMQDPRYLARLARLDAEWSPGRITFSPYGIYGGYGGYGGYGFSGGRGGRGGIRGGGGYSNYSNYNNFNSGGGFAQPGPAPIPVIR